MSLATILVLGLVIGVAWRLVRLAVRIVLLIALLVLIANYGSHLARHSHTSAPGTQHGRTR